MTISVYRKRTHTDHYLHTTTHAPRQALSHAYATELTTYAKEPTNRQNSITYNKFPNQRLPTSDSTEETERLVDPMNQRLPQTPEEMPKKLILPYVQGFSERIERLVRPLNIVPIFTTQTTMSKMAMRVKRKPNKEEISGVVYKIPCECWAAYID